MSGDCDVTIYQSYHSVRVVRHQCVLTTALGLPSFCIDHHRIFGISSESSDFFIRWTPSAWCWRRSMPRKYRNSAGRYCGLGRGYCWVPVLEDRGVSENCTNQYKLIFDRETSHTSETIPHLKFRVIRQNDPNVGFERIVDPDLRESIYRLELLLVKETDWWRHNEAMDNGWKITWY